MRIVVREQALASEAYQARGLGQPLLDSLEVLAVTARVDRIGMRQPPAGHRKNLTVNGKFGGFERASHNRSKLGVRDAPNRIVYRAGHLGAKDRSPWPLRQAIVLRLGKARDRDVLAGKIVRVVFAKLVR